VVESGSLEEIRTIIVAVVAWRWKTMTEADNLLGAKATLDGLISGFSHECGIFSTSPSSHNLVRNLMNRIVQGRCQGRGDCVCAVDVLKR
jgi:hypothetical protein